MEFFDWEMNQHSKQDHYLAQIATEIRRVREMFAKAPKRINIEDALMKFVREGEATPNKEPNDLRTKQQVAEASKSTWAKMFGVRDLSEVSKTKVGKQRIGNGRSSPGTGT